MSEEHTAVIIGAGFSGLGMAAQLKQAGIKDFVVIDKAPEVGGTWWWNKYPGCACDTPSHIYSFSWFPKYDWSHVFSAQPEILEYLKDLAAHFSLYSRIRFNTTATEANWDGSRWTVKTADAEIGRFEEIKAKFLILGGGVLHVPSFPAGSEIFKGKIVHTSDWDTKLSLKGSRVALIGSAASAVQCLPEIATTAESVHVFQRTPSWVSPKKDYPYSDFFLQLMKYVPFAQKIVRGFQSWYQDSLVWKAIFTPKNDQPRPKLEGALTNWMKSVVKDESLHNALTPNYLVGCKRILLSNNYYATFNRENVKLVPHPVAEFYEGGLVANDEKYEADIIVSATGFNPSAGYNYVVGKSGKSLEETWGDLPRAYHGMSIPEFPNCFLLMGPGTASGHTSVILFIEAQIKYILKCIQHMQRNKYSVMEVKSSQFEDNTARLLKGLEKRVWATGGCKSWYQNKNGTTFALYDGTAGEYIKAVKQPVWSHYSIE